MEEGECGVEEGLKGRAGASGWRERGRQREIVRTDGWNVCRERVQGGRKRDEVQEERENAGVSSCHRLGTAKVSGIACRVI